MANSASKTPFPLGAYLNTPDNSNPATEAIFEANYLSFTSLMGTAPLFINNYVDYTLPINEWVNNAGWAAASYAQAPGLVGTTTPVIGLPLASTAAGSSTSDAQFEAFASGQYDSVIRGILQAWVANGFDNLIFRPGWEMNVPGPTYAGSDAQSQTDWVAAFQHVYTLLHQEATLLGATVQVVWNPGAINYTDAEATKYLYPGNSFVDIIGADIYSDMYPYSDTSGTPTYHDWATGGEDTSVAQFIANPINREHYWTFPAATEWSSDSSAGHSESLDSLIQFAEQQGKPFAVPETGAGNSNSGTDVNDDPTFPQWLASQLTAAQASGEKISFVNLWDSNGAGNYEFSNASDNKPLEAAAWAQYFGVQTDPVLCFTRGTRIATPDGEVPVEHLACGDLVLAATGAIRSIVWIGEGRVLATRGRRTAATPVIVREGALSENVPNRDLRVTKGHALYLDGVLIPVEELINHRTIVWDDQAQEVSIYHVELHSHDVLIANGAPAESYRDDGNRWLFRNASPSGHLRPQEPCAPVVSDGPIVDAVWRRLLERSGLRTARHLTNDSDLHLLMDGCRVDAIERREDGMHVFRLRARPRAARLRSRATVPQELGIARDPRMLGVAVQRIVLAQARWQRVIDADSISLADGYHAFEPINRFRWTNGNALVPQELFATMSGPAMLLVQLGCSTQYLDGGAIDRAA